MRPFVATLLLSLVLTSAAFAQDIPTIEAKTQGMERRDGFVPVYWDAAAGKVWLEIRRMNQDFLYLVSLPAGLGSNDVGLDRGQLGDRRIVRFERVGPKVLLVAPNVDYRAVSDNAAERQAVADAFAPGVVWGFTVAAETGDRVLVDATDFVVRDAHAVIRQLRQTGQGSFSLDKDRSALHPAMIKAFPKNTELEARLTFTTDAPGRYVRDVAADPYAVTLRVRHSFVELPGPGFTPRLFHPNSGYFGIAYRDYAVPIGEELTQQFIARHRLECAGQRDANGLCAPSEPIVYYLDPGTPEPVRSALLDGARWWNDAFVAAGYRDAYRVEMLPPDADPLDVRYNVIQWVHRATRGWSYGDAVLDPRTGEIIKGHVSLGSLRVRQDYLLAEGLLAPYEGDKADGLDPANDPMLAMALARLRQLSAHEVGHTLGLAHNFAASINDRASVMDYPAPLARAVADGNISLDDAYAVGIGDWDKLAIRYGYTDFPTGTEETALESVIDEAAAHGLAYLSDTDARPAGAANPISNLWDNDEDIVEALYHEMAVRRVGLARFGPAVIRSDRPLALMEEVLVPLYLRHRYQIDATAKLIGGVAYRYNLRGDSYDPPRPIAGDLQREALHALLETITPEALRLPEAARLIPPRPPGYDPNRELFDGYTGLTFDPYAPAEIAAALVLENILHPERAARLVYQEDFDPTLPGLHDILDRIELTVWDVRTPADPYDAELQRLVQQVWADVLVETAQRDDLAPAVRARLVQHLHARRAWLKDQPGRDVETRAHRTLLFDQIDQFLARPFDKETERSMLETPPGSPIGQSDPLQRQHRRHALLDTLDTSCHASREPSP